MIKIKSAHEELGPFLARKRHESGITQSEVAKNLGISAQMVCNWENGRCGPPNDKLQLLADVLKITKLEFLENILASKEKFYRTSLGLDTSTKPNSNKKTS